jgi:hypothetical protein
MSEETNSETIEEMALRVAMCAHEQYGKAITKWDDTAVAQQARLRHEMERRFGAYQAQEEIKKAYDTLKMISFHSEGDPDDL